MKRHRIISVPQNQIYIRKSKRGGREYRLNEMSDVRQEYSKLDTSENSFEVDDDTIIMEEDVFRDEEDLGDQQQQLSGVVVNGRGKSSTGMTSFEVIGNDDQSKTPNDDTWLSPWLSQKALDWFFPPSTPRSVQLMRKENIAIPACYLLVGLLQGEILCQRIIQLLFAQIVQLFNTVVRYRTYIIIIIIIIKSINRFLHTYIHTYIHTQKVCLDQSLMCIL